jgi:hypothetical protein
MSDVKRYDIVEYGYSPEYSVEESESGPYVLYSDYEKLEAQLAERDQVRLWNENEKQKEQNDVMKKALQDIESMKNMTIYNNSEDYMSGANAGYASCAEIAIQALKEIEDI